MYVLDRTQRLDASLEEVFAFFAEASNLARITPPWLGFRIHGAAPDMAAGVRVEYRIRWLFFTLSWVTRITRFERPAGFQDVQERGPYRRWVHTHTFVADRGAVLMRDRVEYALPFGALGRLAHALVVRRQLQGIFDFRRAAAARIFGNSRPARAS